MTSLLMLLLVVAAGAAVSLALPRRARPLVVLIAAAVALLAVPGAIHADGLDPTQPVDPGDTLASVRVSQWAVQFLIGTLIPILVGIVTKYGDTWKGIALVVLSTASALISQAVVEDGSAVFSPQTLMLAGVAFIQAVASYYGFWRERGITSSGVRQLDGTIVPGKLANVGRK